MAEVTGLNPALVAGNTAESLAGSDRDVVANAGTIEAEFASVDTGATVEGDSEVDAILDEENTFDVSRAEFGELQDAFYRLAKRIDAYNVGAPHKI